MSAVVDTGVLVSALIRRYGIPGEILHALRDKRFTLIYTTPILIEIIDVLGREPFHSKYHIQTDDITALINLIRLRGEVVVPNEPIHACRDPKDDKFLEAAMAGKADVIVSSDMDLLVLNPFANIEILSPSEFIARI